MDQSFLQSKKTVFLSGPVAAGVTEVDSPVVSMGSFDGVCFIVGLGAVTAGAQVNANPQENPLNQAGGMTTLAAGGVQLTDVGGASSNGLMIVDCYRPQKQYVRLQLLRTLQTVAVNFIIAVLYNPRAKPVVQDPTVVGSGLVAGA